MKIMKSQIDASLIVSELKGYRPEANFTVRLTRVSLAGSVAWGVDANGEVSYYDTLAGALNEMSSVIHDKDERKQLLRAL